MTKNEVKENNNKVNTISSMLYSKNAKGEDVREFIIKPADPEIETFLPVGVYASNNKVIYKKQITK